jgi:hypothetical protein
MHQYPLRIDESLWNRIKAESKSRNITIREMFMEVIERGLLQIYEEECNNGKIKHKKINSK